MFSNRCYTCVFQTLGERRPECSDRSRTRAERPHPHDRIVRFARHVQNGRKIQIEAGVSQLSPERLADRLGQRRVARRAERHIAGEQRPLGGAKRVDGTSLLIDTEKEGIVYSGLKLPGQRAGLPQTFHIVREKDKACRTEFLELLERGCRSSKREQEKPPDLLRLSG